MEIIHLILGKANPERMNGVNKVVYQLATRQAASGRNVAVWGITKEMNHNYGERNFETLLFPAKKNTFQIDDTLKKAILSKKGKAIFHLHGGWIPTYATVSKFLSKHQISFVLTPHGAYNAIAMQRSRWTKKLYFHIFEKHLLHRALKVHAIGESEVDGLQQIYPNNKSFLLPYGFVTQPPPCEKHHENDGLIIGFVGRLDIYTKGLDLLINAFQKFQQEEPHATLWIVGDGDEKPALAKMIVQKKLEHVVLWGSKFGKEKDELMRRMHVFAHPSRNEGLPASVLEAANMSIPCVVSKATNVGSFISQYDAGITIDNEDVDALTKAFTTFRNKHKEGRLAEISSNAKAMVREVFDWDQLISKFDALYY